MVETPWEREERRKKEQEERIKRRASLECLPKSELKKFIWDMHRAETDENKRVYIKAIRSCLIALGYSEDWVNGDFYDLILDEYDY